MNGDLFDTMRRLGMETDNPDAEYWDQIFSAIDQSDERFDVLSPERRARVLELRARVDALTPRESAFLVAAAIECIGVANAEAGGAS